LPRNPTAQMRTILPTLSPKGGWNLSGTSVVQRGKRFAVVAYAGIDPETKKQRQKWFGGFATRKEAEQFRLTLATNPAFSAGSGPYGSPRLRLRDYLTTWLDERRALRELRPRTADRYDELIGLHIVPRLGHVSLVRLAPPAVQHLYVSMLQAGLAPATVRQAARVLHAALQTAVRRGLIAKNPADQTTLPQATKFEPTILTPEQITAYLSDAKVTAGPALYALYVVCVGCGTRLGEALAVGEKDVDLEHSLLHIRRTLVHAGLEPVFGPPKSERGRRAVLLPGEATAAIRAVLTWKKTQRLGLGPRFQDSGLLLCGPTGRPLNPSNIRNRDHLPRLARIGLPRIRLHDLRHAHATYLVAAGVDHRTVADRLGHASPSFTLVTYAHAASAAQQQAAAVANELRTKSMQTAG
jgi:integrase